jgi:hypothetical protein
MFLVTVNENDLDFSDPSILSEFKGFSYLGMKLRSNSDIKKTNNLKKRVNNTVILSFLKRERERTVNVILQSFLTVYLVHYDRFVPFTVPDRPPFLTVTDRY